MLKLSEKQKQLLLLLLIILLGAVLRFYKLDFQSLDNDELTSWNLSNKSDSISDVVKKQAEHDVNPPGYQIILFYVIKYLGDNEFWLRLPSVAAGILSIYLIYLLGLKLFSSKEGLLAAALTAISWCPIYYSQEARTYSLMFLFSIVTMLFWIDIVTEEASGKFKPYIIIAAYSLSAIITISLHYFGLLLISLQSAGMLFYFLAKKKSLKNFLIAYGIIFLAFIPFIPPLLIDFNPSFKTFIKTPAPFIFVEVIYFFFNNSYWFVALAAGLYLFLFIKFIYDKRISGKGDKKNNFILLVLILWLVVPFLVSFLISVTVLPVLKERYLIISLPAALLIFSHAVVQLPINFFLKKIFIGALIFIFLFHLIVKTSYYSRPTKPEFKSAAKYVVEREKDGDPFVIGFCWSEYMFNYYFERMGSEIAVDDILGQENDIEALAEFN